MLFKHRFRSGGFLVTCQGHRKRWSQVLKDFLLLRGRLLRHAVNVELGGGTAGRGRPWRKQLLVLWFFYREAFPWLGELFLGFDHHIVTRRITHLNQGFRRNDRTLRTDHQWPTLRLVEFRRLALRGQQLWRVGGRQMPLFELFRRILWLFRQHFG